MTRLPNYESSSFFRPPGPPSPPSPLSPPKLFLTETRFRLVSVLVLGALLYLSTSWFEVILRPRRNRLQLRESKQNSMRSRILSVPLFFILTLVLSCPSFLAQQSIDTKAQRGAADPVVPHDSPVSPAAQESLAQGQDLMFKQHDAKASIPHFKKVIELDPAFLQGHILLGNAYMQTAQWAEAQSAFEKAAKLEPQSSVALLGIGAALNQQLDYAGAQEPLRQSLELNRDSAEAHYELARALWGLNKWEEAEPHVHKAIQLNKDYASPHILMGNIYLQEENPTFAMTEFQEYLRLEPQGPDAPAVKEIVAKIQKALGTPEGRKRTKATPKSHFLPPDHADRR